MLDKVSHEKSKKCAHNKVRSKSISFLLFFKKNKKKKDSPNYVSAIDRKSYFQNSEEDEKKEISEKSSIKIMENRNNERPLQTIQKSESLLKNEINENINDHNEFQKKDFHLKKKRESFFKKINILQKFKNYKIKKTTSTFHTFNDKISYSENYNKNGKSNNLEYKENNNMTSEFYNNLNKSKSYSIKHEFNSIKSKAQRLKKKINLKKKSKSKLMFNKDYNSEIIHNDNMVIMLNEAHSIKNNFKRENSLEYDEKSNNYEFKGNTFSDKNNISNSNETIDKSKNNEMCSDLLYKKTIENNNEYIMNSNKNSIDINEHSSKVKREDFIISYDNKSSQNSIDKANANLNYKFNCMNDKNSEKYKRIKEDSSKKNNDQMIRNIKHNISNNLNSINNFLIYKNNENIHLNVNEKINKIGDKKNEEFNCKKERNIVDFPNKKKDIFEYENIERTYNDSVYNLNKTNNVDEKNFFICNKFDKEQTNEKEIILKLMYNNNGIYFNKDEHMNSSLYFEDKKPNYECIEKNKNVASSENINKNKDIYKNTKTTFQKKLPKNTNNNFNKKFHSVNNFHRDKIQGINTITNNSGLNKNINLNILSKSYNKNMNRHFIQSVNNDSNTNEIKNNLHNDFLNLKYKNSSSSNIIKKNNQNDISKNENLGEEKSSIISKYFINPLYNLFLQSREDVVDNSNIKESEKIDSFKITKNYTNELQKTYKTMYDICDSSYANNQCYGINNRKSNELQYINSYNNYNLNSCMTNNNLKSKNYLFINNKIKDENDKRINYLSNFNKNIVENKIIQNDHVKNIPTSDINYLNKNAQIVYLDNTYYNNDNFNSKILKEEYLKCVENRNYSCINTGNINHFNTPIKNNSIILYDNSSINNGNKNCYIKNNITDKSSIFNNIFTNNNNSTNNKVINNYESNGLKKECASDWHFSNEKRNYSGNKNSHIYNMKNCSNHTNSILINHIDNFNDDNQKNFYVNDFNFQKPFNNLRKENDINENINYNNNIIGYNGKVNDKMPENDEYLKKFVYLQKNRQLLNKNYSNYNCVYSSDLESNQRYDNNIIHKSRNEYMKNNFSSDLNDLKNENNLTKFHSFSIDHSSICLSKDKMKTEISSVFKNNHKHNTKRTKSLNQIRMSNFNPNSLDIYQESYIKSKNENNNYINCNNCNESSYHINHENMIRRDGKFFINNSNNELKDFSQKDIIVYSKDNIISKNFKNENKYTQQRNKSCKLFIKNRDSDDSNSSNIKNDNNYNNETIIKNDNIPYETYEEGEALWLNNYTHIEEDLYGEKNNMIAKDAAAEKYNYFNSLNIKKNSDFINNKIILEKNKENGLYNIVSGLSDNLKNVKENQEDIFISHQYNLSNDNEKATSENDYLRNEIIRYYNKIKKKKNYYSSLEINTYSDISQCEKLYRSDYISQKKKKNTKLKKKHAHEEKRINNNTNIKCNMVKKENCTHDKLKKMEMKEKENKKIKNTTLKKNISIENNIVEKRIDTKSMFRSSSPFKIGKNNFIYNSIIDNNKNRNIKNLNINKMKSIKNSCNFKEEMDYKKGNINPGNSKQIYDSSKSKQTCSEVNKSITKEKNGNNEIRKHESYSILVKKGNYNSENGSIAKFHEQLKEYNELRNSTKKENTRNIIKKKKKKKEINQKIIEKIVLTNSSKSNKIEKKKKKRKGILYKQINESNANLKDKSEINFSDQNDSILSNKCVKDKLNTNSSFLNEKSRDSIHECSNRNNNNLTNIEEDSMLYKNCNKRIIYLKNEKINSALKKNELLNLPEISFLYKEVKIMNHILSNINNFNFLNSLKISDLIYIEKNFINNNIYINKQIITSNTKNNKLNETSEDDIMYDNNFSIIHLKQDIIYLKKNYLKIILNVLINNISSFYEIKAAIILLKFFISIEDSCKVFPSLYPLSLINALIQKFRLKIHKKNRKKDDISNVNLEYNSKKLPFNYLFICDGKNYLCINDDSLKSKTYKSKIKLNNLIGYYHYINLNRLTYYLEKTNDNITIQ
ncbi:conserved Plasmodium protein, unknown function [Plasmodium relictum]|uniref:Uncharacterized protein n=1 Tax=Plasmodium relictum TaxID=85471 RepID=A0A1J1H5M8_PLARL|nr:conserved Plasmodium protein, unknown function [Plasmodium relictum]CRH00215.1 conserved Plasmodium protein, unknown function [Plasmodium relictum]